MVLLEIGCLSNLLTHHISALTNCWSCMQVATGGSGGILRPTLDGKLNSLHKAIATLAANSSEESEEEHVLNNFHSSRTIRKLVLDCPTFARTFWKKALKGKSKLWAQGHR
jgi:pumilio family protein 6